MTSTSSWGPPEGPHWAPAPAELAALDDLAQVLVADDLDQIRSAYAQMPVPPVITTIVDGSRKAAHIGELARVGTEPSIAG